MNERKWFFSLTSGEVYDIDANEAAMLDDKQIVLKCKPPTSCSKCYGRFYTSYYSTGGYFIICNKCGKKSIDYSKYAKSDPKNK